MTPPNPDLYIVAPVREHLTIDLHGKDLPGQFFTFEERLEFFLLLPEPRVIDINPAFVTIVSPTPMPYGLVKEGIAILERLKERGVIAAYRVLNRWGSDDKTEKQL